jgi:hypothetical protein
MSTLNALPIPASGPKRGPRKHHGSAAKAAYKAEHAHVPKKKGAKQDATRKTREAKANGEAPPPTKKKRKKEKSAKKKEAKKVKVAKSAKKSGK